MQQEPGKTLEAADLGQQLCRALRWESSHQCWTEGVLHSGIYRVQG